VNTITDSAFAYEWHIILRDGRALREFDEGAQCWHHDFPRGHGHLGDPKHSLACLGGHAEFPEDVALIRLMPQAAGFQPVTVTLPEDARLIFRRREGEHKNMNAGGTRYSTITLVGWQRRVGERNEQSVLAVLEDGSITVADNWKHMQPSYAWAWAQRTSQPRRNGLRHIFGA
jgi:hypothetical protein